MIVFWMPAVQNILSLLHTNFLSNVFTLLKGNISSISLWINSRQSTRKVISDNFTCTSANVIYCITCTCCNKLYIDETGRRLGDRFREHLRDVERNDKDASKPVAIHSNLAEINSHHFYLVSRFYRNWRSNDRGPCFLVIFTQDNVM